MEMEKNLKSIRKSIRAIALIERENLLHKLYLFRKDVGLNCAVEEKRSDSMLETLNGVTQLLDGE